MAEPFLGEIRIMSFNFAPKGWAQCNGQFMPINQNQALFALLGTMFGGNGQTTFGLPDFRGRTGMHVGAGFNQGQALGQEFHTVTLSELPAHTHMAQASSTTGNQPVPTNNLLARNTDNVYQTAGNLVTLNAGTIPPVGGSQPHENRSPFQVLNFCIALIGIFPSRN